MIVSPCPCCHDDVLVPDGIGDDEEVRCPLCQAEFPFSEIRWRLPPALIRVSAPVASAQQFSELDELRLAPEDAQPKQSSFDVGEAPAPQTTAERRRPRASRSNSSRPQKNALVEFLKIALGGVVGLALAVLIIWWGLQKDPFNIGPSVGQYVPWLVPERFRPSSETSEAPPETAAEDDGEFAWPAESEQGKTSSQERKLVPLGKASSFPLDDELPQAGEIDEDEVSPESLQLVGVVSAPTFKEEEINQVAQQVCEALEEWRLTDVENASTSESKRLYEALAQLAKRVTFGESQASEQALPDIASMLTQSPDAVGLAKLIRNYGCQQLPSSDQFDGAALLGVVEETAEQDPLNPLNKTVVEALTSDGRAKVTVCHRGDPQEAFQKGTRMILLGAVIKDPQRNLGGYKGNESQVVWSGYPVTGLPLAGTE